MPQFLQTIFQVCFASLLLFSACKKDDDTLPDPLPDPDPVENPYTVLDCTDESEVTAIFAALNESGFLLESVVEDTAHILLTFENDSIYGLAPDCIIGQEAFPEDWTFNLTFASGNEFQIDYIGEINLEANLNPSAYAPLTADLTVSAPLAGSVTLRIIGKNGPYSDVVKAFDGVSQEQTVPVLGLYPEYENLVEVQYFSEAGGLRVIDTISITTGSLPTNFPPMQVTKRSEGEMAVGMNLVNYKFLNNPNVPFMADAYADVRWYLDYTDHPDLNKLDYLFGLERLKNGNLYFCNAADDTIYEVDIMGRVLNSWPLPVDNIFHHDVHEKADGNFLVTVSNLNSVHLNGNNCKEDYILEIDRQTGDLIMTWDLKEPLDEYRTVLEDNLDNPIIDWIHVNAVIDDPSDNTIIVSGRQQGIAKIDYDNQLVWVLGTHLGWGENRYGQDVNDYLLTAVDEAGVPYSDDIQDGYENHSQFEWPWFQHAPLILPNGHLVLFDNGPYRNYGPDGDKYSRTVEYEIDPLNKTIRQVWQYGKERQQETWARVASDVDYLEERNHILFCPGVEVQNTNGLGGKIVEVNHNTSEVVFELEINSPNSTFLTAERLTLYTD
ncbi:MAG: aryl-sulfate sulfotransferase [Bacteroidetes bacterium]|nr:aryl-sulfate sulfotransferase [Bacteroidota bacterium]